MSTGRSAGNENRRWHGTRRICNIGDKGHTQFCSAPTCSLCCIMRSSFDVSLWGKKTGWGRCVYPPLLSNKAEVIIKWQIRKRNIHFVNLLQVCFESFYIFVLRFNLFFSQTDLFRSNDYSHNDCKSTLKAILLNKVVVGKGCKLLQDNTSLTAPPTGYDSVSFC